MANPLLLPDLAAGNPISPPMAMGAPPPSLATGGMPTLPGPPGAGGMPPSLGGAPGGLDPTVLLKTLFGGKGAGGKIGRGGPGTRRRMRFRKPKAPRKFK